jgi:hypothetical protein
VRCVVISAGDPGGVIGSLEEKVLIAQPYGDPGVGAKYDERLTKLDAERLGDRPSHNGSLGIGW